jgi:hypothetical protein
MAYGRIYLAIDLTNGKSYCGQETGASWDRKSAHLRSSKNDHFHNALKKRSCMFVWMIICECENQDELNASELSWGEYFECIVPTGYSFILGHANGRQAAEQRAKTSAASKGKKKTPEHAAKLANVLKIHRNKVPWNKGKKLPSPSSERNAKASASMKKVCATKVWSRKKRV